jgi:sporulation protein YlmC with PRC-barrel domain
MAQHTHTQFLSSTTLLGDHIRNTRGEELGKLEEIMLDLDTGQIAYAVLSFGGFLGLGDKLFAIPWQALTVDTENKEIVLAVSKEKLENAPGFDKDDWPESLDRNWVAEVYNYYGYQPY